VFEVMGRTKGEEEYFVKRGGKWVPMDSPPSSKPKTSSKSSEEYYIKRDGRWVKVDGVSSPEDIIRQLQKPRAPRPTQQTVVRESYTAAAPAPAPLEYREYFVKVNQPEPPPPPPAPVQRAPPNEYAPERPIRPREVEQYRRPPPPRLLPPREPCIVVPPPRPIVHVHPPPRPVPKVDAFEAGRAAFLRERVAVRPARRVVDYDYDDDDDDESVIMPRTSPAPGYYLAGYLYNGDTSQGLPELRPLPTGGAPAARGPPGCGNGYPDQPSSVEMVYEEYGIAGEEGEEQGQWMRRDNYEDGRQDGFYPDDEGPMYPPGYDQGGYGPGY
jgi:hypothetical protein